MFRGRSCDGGRSNDDGLRGRGSLNPTRAKIILQCCAQIANDVRFVGNAPALGVAVVVLPAKEAQCLNRLIRRVRVPRVDFGIHGLNPTDIAILPRVRLRLGDEYRTRAQRLRNDAQKILVRAKMQMPRVVRGIIVTLFARNQTRVENIERVRVQCQRVGRRIAFETFIQNVAKVIHPIAAGIAGVLRLCIPRPRRRGNNPIVAMP